MNGMVMFSHEKLDVYQKSLDFAHWAYVLSKKLKGADRYIRDQLIRASQSIPLNIAEGNGKRSLADRQRFFQIACGSSLECAAILDLLYKCEVINGDESALGKKTLFRIVSMLTKMTSMPGGKLGEEISEYEKNRNDCDYEYDYGKEWKRGEG